MSRAFFIAAVIYGFLGLLLGLQMAISHDHSQMPTHAHMQVLGWLSFFAFGIYYHLIPSTTGSFLAKVHFWLAQITAPIMLIGLYGLSGSMPQLEPLAAGGAVIYTISFACFALVVIRHRG